MTPSTAVAPELNSEVQLDILKVLLLDQETIDAEFARIMTVSGFGGRAFVAVLTPFGSGRARRKWKAARIYRDVTVVKAPRRDRRVRSPPQEAILAGMSPEPRRRAPGGIGVAVAGRTSNLTEDERSCQQ